MSVFQDWSALRSREEMKRIDPGCFSPAGKNPFAASDDINVWIFRGVAIASFVGLRVMLNAIFPGSAPDAAIFVQGALFATFVVLAILTVWLLFRTTGNSRTGEQETERRSGMLNDEIAAHNLSETELLRAKIAAEAANAAKTRYLVAVSHEIRSPLNAIYGYSQLLEREESNFALEAGGVIRRSAEHLMNLVEGLLEISRVEGGVLRLRSDVVQLSSLLEHVVDMFRMQAEAKGIVLRYEITGRLPRFVRTDEKRLRQILINLLSNSIKYTPQGSVTLSITYRSQVATVDVSDTGIGISPEDLERIFEPFERGSSPEAALQAGIGLGLAITRVLAQIMGGDITATSTSGAGSCFRLRMFLPEPFTEPSDAAEYSRPIGYQGRRRTALIIDDHHAQTVVLDNLLRPLGFIVYTACNGTEGLALAEHCRPDIVLLDVQMPGIDGWEVASRLRAAHGDAIRIVMVSANAYEFRAGGDGAQNHDALISKPVELEALLAIIGRELRLSWEVRGDHPSRTAVDLLPSLPVGAGKWVEQLRRLAKVGHIRAVEAALSDLETNVPESAPAVAAMRYHVDNFDLRSLLKMLDGDQPR